MMTSDTSNISPNQALEEKLFNMHEQLAGATSRLDQTERTLDFEPVGLLKKNNFLGIILIDWRDLFTFASHWITKKIITE